MDFDLNHKEPAGANADQVDLVWDRTVIDRTRHIGKHNPAIVRRTVAAELREHMLNSDSLAFVDALAEGNMVNAHLTSAQNSQGDDSSCWNCHGGRHDIVASVSSLHAALRLLRHRISLSVGLKHFANLQRIERPKIRPILRQNKMRTVSA